jgi:hypothetical protein
MCAEDAASTGRGNGFDEVEHREQTQKILRFPELRSQSELDNAASRSVMFARLCRALQRSPVTGLESPEPSLDRSGRSDE